ncbi:Glycosyltransferase, catalytic subunit of cellulose synthase and poly-beta-1,6-N-acetylglucosamine synthase [Haloechinothrix alba]|uniref:Glycosyltransferase, catalytic subunit of cellulose synthase and poly-beta-1,6-N-acetylglucosamine synthase n=1 Tax=Haloechinothrix alba TaxID=664784 RepID=A0A238X4U1_9PSEU|nr:glycosyltransferase family 2 protein [Haloechinothrix alba]SNR53384.1 Glycosyltransferase, catalytic subunit of cellulose synthase and poly-beta-1,6-N-acetylglucosamine synthase [Haloechinothrix alba]
MEWWLALFVFGVSITLWIGVGLLRLLTQDAVERRRRVADSTGARRLTPADVAVLIPAHNEEASIAATITSVLRLVPGANVHVVADGCTDRTTEIAGSFGVNVLELQPSRGKAGGIEAAVEHFELARRFELMLITDADTRLDRHYLDRGLRLMEDPAMAALAGYAHVDWQPAAVNGLGRLLLSYRTRLYAVMQGMKYGQTWRHTNVTPIVPGFASMYRTRLLPRMELNPPGLVIEDFNMTFELHRKKLGKIAFEPSVYGICQDPENLRDYYRQICRWWLGFWQTLRRHGLWFSVFSAALVLFLFEVFVVSLVLLLVVASLVFLAAEPATGGLALQWDWYAPVHAWLDPLITPLNLVVFLWLPDYLLTCLVALWLRRPSLLVYGVGFIFLRVLDAVVTVRTLIQLCREKSTGRWTSPARRSVQVLSADGHAPGAAGGDVAGGVAVAAPADDRPAAALNWRDAAPVLFDGALVLALLLLAAALLVLGVAASVILGMTVATVVVCALLALIVPWYRARREDR